MTGSPFRGFWLYSGVVWVACRRGATEQAHSPKSMGFITPSASPSRRHRQSHTHSHGSQQLRRHRTPPVHTHEQSPLTGARTPNDVRSAPSAEDDGGRRTRRKPIGPLPRAALCFHVRGVVRVTGPARAPTVTTTAPLQTTVVPTAERARHCASVCVRGYEC